MIPITSSRKWMILLLLPKTSKPTEAVFCCTLPGVICAFVAFVAFAAFVAVAGLPALLSIPAVATLPARKLRQS